MIRWRRPTLLASIVLLHVALAYLLTQQRAPSAFDQRDPPAPGKPAPSMLTPIVVAPGNRTRESGVLPRTEQREKVETHWVFAPVYILPGASHGQPPLPESSRRLTQAEAANAVSGPTISSKVLPNYPTESVRAAEEGAVSLRARVDETGKASDWKVVSSSGSNRLDSAAQGAVSQWTLTPAMDGSHAVASSAEVEFRFRMYPITFSLLESSASAEAPIARSSLAGGTRLPPLGEAALRALIAGTGPLSPHSAHEERVQREAVPLRTAVATWGNVVDIRFLRFHGSSGWQTYSLKPEYRVVAAEASSSARTAVIRWESYEVNHEHLTSAWRVAVDEGGRIWAVKTGLAPWHE